MTDTTESRWEQHNEAGRGYFVRGELAQAEQAFIAAIREATMLGADNLRLAASLSNLGQLKYRQKDFAQAEALFRRSLAIRERVQGPDHYSVVQNINNLAALHFARGELDLAEPLFQRALAVSEKHLGLEHPDVAVCLNNLARLFFRRADHGAAAPLLMRLLTIKERTLGGEHPEVAGILSSLVKVRFAEGQHDAAEQLCRRVLHIREKTLSPGDPAMATSLDSLAEITAALGKVDEELEIRGRALAIREQTLGQDHPSVVAARATIDALQRRAGSRVVRAQREAPMAQSMARLSGEFPSLPHTALESPSGARPVPLAARAVAVPAAHLPEPVSAPSLIPTAASSVAMPPLGATSVAPMPHAEAATPPAIVAPPTFPADAQPVLTIAPAYSQPEHVADPGFSARTPSALSFSFSNAAAMLQSRLTPSTPPLRIGQQRRSAKYVAVAAAIIIAVGGWLVYGHRTRAEPQSVTGAGAPALERSEGKLVSRVGRNSPAAADGPSADLPATANAAVPPAPIKDTPGRPNQAPAPEDVARSGKAAKVDVASASDPAIPKAGVVDAARLTLDRVSKAIDDSTRSHVDYAGRTLNVKPPTFRSSARP